MLAGYNGYADCARLLLDAGADKNAKANVRSSAGCCKLALLCGGGDDDVLFFENAFRLHF